MVFSRYESDWEKIKIFSTPKVLRFAEILEQFQPPDGKNTNKDKVSSDAKICIENIYNNENSQTNAATENQINENAVNDEIDSVNENISNDKNNDSNTDNAKSNTNKLLDALEKCDFISLSNRIEDRVHIIKANLKEINLIPDCEENKKSNENKDVNNSENEKSQNNYSKNKMNQNTINDSENKVNENDNRVNDKGMFPRRAGHRTRGRGRIQRSSAAARAQQLQQNPDALCGIVFMKEALMAKIMFMLIVVSKMLYF